MDGGSPADEDGEATLAGRMQKVLENDKDFESEVEIPCFLGTRIGELKFVTDDAVMEGSAIVWNKGK